MDIDNDDNTAKYTALIFGVGFLIVGFAVMLPTATSQADAESDQATGTPKIIESVQQLGPRIATSSSVAESSEGASNGTTTAPESSHQQNTRTPASNAGTDSTVNTDTASTENNQDRGFDNPRQLYGDDTENAISPRDRLFGGEAYISDYALSGRSVLRERKSRSVASISFNVNDGDVLTNRIDVSFVPVGNDGDDKPWEVFKTITIKSGRTTLASTSISQKEDWLDDGSDYDGELSGDDQFRVRVKSLNHVIEQSNTGRLSIHLTAQDNVADAGDDVRWGVFVDDSGIRAVDAAGVRHSFGEDSETATFTVQEGPDPDTLLHVGRSYANPDSSAIDVSARKRSDAYSIFAFDIETQDVDVTVNTITLQMEIKGGHGTDATFNEVIDSTAIALDGQIFTLDNLQSVSSVGSKNVYELTFQTDGVTIDNYNDKNVRLLARFKQAAGNYTDGTIVRGSVRNGGVESTDGLTNSSEIPGRWHQLRRGGPSQ